MRNGAQLVRHCMSVISAGDHCKKVEDGNFVDVDRASRVCPNRQYSSNHNMDGGAIHVLV